MIRRARLPVRPNPTFTGVCAWYLDAGESWLMGLRQLIEDATDGPSGAAWPPGSPAAPPRPACCRLWQLQNKMAAVGGGSAYDARLDRVVAARTNLEQRLQVGVVAVGGCL